MFFTRCPLRVTVQPSQQAAPPKRAGQMIFLCVRGQATWDVSPTAQHYARPLTSRTSSGSVKVILNLVNIGSALLSVGRCEASVSQANSKSVNDQIRLTMKTPFFSMASTTYMSLSSIARSFGAMSSIRGAKSTIKNTPAFPGKNLQRWSDDGQHIASDNARQLVEGSPTRRQFVGVSQSPPVFFQKPITELPVFDDLRENSIRCRRHGVRADALFNHDQQAGIVL